MKAIILNILLCAAVLVILSCSGCVAAPSKVVLDSPGLAFALVFVGTCAVLCTSIGGVCLVKACRAKKK